MNHSEKKQAEVCPICGKSGERLPVERSKDYIMYRCSYCRGDFAQTFSSFNYQLEYRVGEDSFRSLYRLRALSEPEKELKEAKLFANFRQALKFLRAFSPKGKLLDIGCGTGVFPKLAESLGFEVYAFDPVAEAIRYARDNFRLKNVIAGTIDDLPHYWQNFDFITCFEVLEHLEQPRDLVKKIYELLVPGGHLIMSVPNRDRFYVKLGLREAWDCPPNHLNRWSKEVLWFFLTGVGFVDIRVKIDGMTRWALASILLPASFNRMITKRKLEGLITKDKTKKEFFLENPLWRLVQVAGNSVALALSKVSGLNLIGFAQRPHSN